MGTSLIVHAQSVCGTWNLVSSANPSSAYNALTSVAVVSANDVWAVGGFQKSGNIFQTTAQHWDGSSWTTFITPNVGNSDNLLLSVVALASNDVWAAGYSSDFGKAEALIEHWDGSSWQVVSNPKSTGGAYLNGIAAISRSDIWAVGGQTVGAPGPDGGSLTLHYDGSTWSVISSPNVADRTNDLDDVTVIASNDVWAVGYSRNVAGSYQSFSMHWDGSAWSLVSAPTVGSYSQLYTSIAASSSDVWATGLGTDSKVNPIPLFLHWDGQVWSSVASPGGGGRDGLALFASNDIWSVGDTITHWDGSTWSLVAGATVPGATRTTLNGAAKVANCDVWAVGLYSTSSGTFTLTEHLQSTGSVTVASASFNPASLLGGGSSTGTVTLTGNAPAGGLVVTLSSGNAAVAVPASVTVAEGATSATFNAATSAVSSTTTVTVTAAGGGTSAVAMLTLTPASPFASFTLSPTSVTGGGTSNGTVTLSDPAPSGGGVVTLSSSNPSAATVPASVTVNPGAILGFFTVTSKQVSTTTNVTISATYQGTTASATLTVNPIAVSSLTLNPTSVKGGTSSTGTVKLSSAAPSGGTQVKLTSNNTTVATVPVSVTVAAGLTSANFTVTTKAVSAAKTVTISATRGGVTKRATLTVTK